MPLTAQESAEGSLAWIGRHVRIPASSFPPLGLTAASTLAAAKPAVPTASSHPGPPSLAQAAAQHSAQAASPPRNAVCGHVCCALREQCIVAELRKVGQAYQAGGRTDQFKQKVGRHSWGQCQGTACTGATMAHCMQAAGP